jgi:hypothetical protein
MSTRLNATILVGALSVSSAVSAEPNSTLQGCWRSQHVLLTMSDKSQRNQNGDCVVEYSASHARSLCHGDNGRTETLSTYELLGPGRLRITPVDATTGKPKAPSFDMGYRIEGAWLLFDRQFDQAPSTGSKQPANLRSVSVRVLQDMQRCEPFGESGLRVGNTPKSSLQMSTPQGWRPLLVPATDARLAPAVEGNFLIGAFAPATSPIQSQFVLVLDDIRSGPSPVQAGDFKEIKERFRSELRGGKLTCDEPDRACAFVKQADGQAYTSLVNLKGRVAIVTATTVGEAKTSAESLLRKSVDTFVATLRAENSK